MARIEAAYWAEPEGRYTLIHCSLNGVNAKAIVDWTPDEEYTLPDEVLEAIKDRLYAICMERLEEMRNARTQVRPRSSDQAGHHRDRP